MRTKYGSTNTNLDSDDEGDENGNVHTAAPPRRRKHRTNDDDDSNSDSDSTKDSAAARNVQEKEKKATQMAADAIEMAQRSFGSGDSVPDQGKFDEMETALKAKLQQNGLLHNMPNKLLSTTEQRNKADIDEKERADRIDKKMERIQDGMDDLYRITRRISDRMRDLRRSLNIFLETDSRVESQPDPFGPNVKWYTATDTYGGPLYSIYERISYIRKDILRSLDLCKGVDEMVLLELDDSTNSPIEGNLHKQRPRLHARPMAAQASDTTAEEYIGNILKVTDDARAALAQLSTLIDVMGPKALAAAP